MLPVENIKFGDAGKGPKAHLRGFYECCHVADSHVLQSLVFFVAESRLTPPAEPLS